MVGASGFDVLVLGGGPAGAATASVLSRAGAKTLLLHVPGGERRKGEILDPRGAKLLESVGISPALLDGVSHKVPGHVIHWSDSSEEVSAVANPSGFSRLVDRNLFDSQLRQAASRSGSSIAELVRPASIEHLGGKWFASFQFRNACCNVHAPVLIDCSGRRASVARRYGQRKRIDKLICDYYLSFTASTDLDSRWIVESDQLGWWFSVRIGEGERVFCRFHDTPKRKLGLQNELRENCAHLSSLAAQHRCTARKAERVDASTYILCLNHHSLIAVGDAAFAVDPLSGQGVSLAIAQGILAGTACIEYLGGSTRALSHLADIQRQEYELSLARRTKSYMACGRWNNAPFWHMRLT